MEYMIQFLQYFLVDVILGVCSKLEDLDLDFNIITAITQYIHSMYKPLKICHPPIDDDEYTNMVIYDDDDESYNENYKSIFLK